MLDFSKYLQVGEKIQVQYTDANNNVHEYSSQVVEFYSNGMLDILIPLYKNQIVYFRNDAKLKIVVPKGEAVFEFQTQIAEKQFGKIPLLRLQVSGQVNKIQRRNYFRLKVIKELEGRTVINLKERKFGDKFKGNLLDISGGGIQFNMLTELEENASVELTMTLNDKKMTLFGIIVRKNFTNNAKAPFLYGVRFDRMSEFERNEIMKFIFEEQRKLIKKGLI